MAKRANIVTFDDARSASRRRRARSGESFAQSDRRFSPYSSPRNSDYVRPRSAASGARGNRELDDFEWDEPYRDQAPSRRRSESSARTSGRNASSSRDAGKRKRPAQDAPESKRERRRRERAKSRADKMFDKQYDADAMPSEVPDGAPRAAVYEAKMGASHRKSARMQRASTALPQTAKLNPAGWFSNINVSARTLKIGTALLCIVLMGVFLYVPAQQYYQSVREHDRLAAEYAYIEQRNQVLDSQNASLASNAGMEDAVRQKYGYVVGGDETAIVSGLSDHATDTSRDSDGIEANVLASSVKAPEEWYTPYLDALFGVS